MKNDTIQIKDGIDLCYYNWESKKNVFREASKLLKNKMGKDIYAIGSKFGFEKVKLESLFLDIDGEIIVGISNGKDRQTGKLFDLIDVTDY